MELYAIVSDVHGNVWALDAVLDDARRRGVTCLLNLGDVLYGPLDPAATFERLHSLELPSSTIRGNQDRILYDPAADEGLHRSLAFTRDALPPAAMDWIRALPESAVAHERLRLCHGTPASDEVYLLEGVSAEGVGLRPQDELAAMVRDVREPVLLCGHSHIPRAVTVGPLLVVNPGSVGLPAYADDVPVPHRMETGSPRARYAIVRLEGERWVVEHVAVAYDHERAAWTAERHGRPDWARALRTGWA